jgi:outer membrane protein assembly factor BamB
MWLLPLLLLLASSLAAPGYTSLQVGVDSNFLVDDDRVCFAQSDGSLTVLSLQSGEVLARDRSRNFSGTLLRVSPGLLACNGQTVALLDPTNLNIRWESACLRTPAVTQNTIITQDGHGRIECRDLADGRLNWSFALPGALQVVAAAGRVLVHRPATYEAGVEPATVMLDGASGAELYRKRPPDGIQWGPVFFDGTNIFMTTGPFHRLRGDYLPERLAVWNVNGEELSSIPIPADLRQRAKDGGLLDLDGRTFWKGQVYTSRQSMPWERLGREQTTIERTNDHSITFETDYDLGEGVTFIAHAKRLDETNGLGGSFVMQVELRTPSRQWAGVLPYLLDRGRIVALAVADGRLLIGTDFGQVECINADTGQSWWLYTFPTLRRTLSYSSRSLPPMESEAAEAFRHDNANPPTSGLHVINGKARAPRIVTDPDPVNPYRRLPLHRALAWCGAGLGFLVLSLIHLIAWLRRWETSVAGAAAVWLTFLLFCFYLALGRVSPASSLALKMAILAGFVFSFWDAAKSFRRGLRMEGAILTITLAGIVLFMILTLA